jgi:hypothetical protein
MTKKDWCIPVQLRTKHFQILEDIKNEFVDFQENKKEYNYLINKENAFYEKLVIEIIYYMNEEHLK